MGEVGGRPGAELAGGLGSMLRWDERPSAALDGAPEKRPEKTLAIRESDLMLRCGSWLDKFSRQTFLTVAWCAVPPVSDQFSIDARGAQAS